MRGMVPETSTAPERDGDCSHFQLRVAVFVCARAQIYEAGTMKGANSACKWGGSRTLKCASLPS